jgi:hypothetical protein
MHIAAPESIPRTRIPQNAFGNAAADGRAGKPETGSMNAFFGDPTLTA